MIFLDTNFLIPVIRAGTPEDQQSRNWLAQGEILRLSVVVWAEFLCGPISTEDMHNAQALMGSPEPLVGIDAERGAELFNATGRRRTSLADCLVAATCLRFNAPLATADVADFKRFAPMGLQLVLPG